MKTTMMIAAFSLAACVRPTPTFDAGPVDGDACKRASIGAVTFSFQDDVSTHYEARLTTPVGDAAPDYLVLQFFNYNERIGAQGAGTFALDDATNDNYGHCAECLLIFADQATPTSAPGRIFFQSGGTLSTTANPREGIDLHGRVEGLTLVESTIGGETLESAPVEGGDCIVVDDFDLAVDYTPPEWTCDPAAYDAGDGVCDCGCGGDPDCYPLEGFPASTTGCAANQTCWLDTCHDTCDAFGGTPCVAANDVCAFSSPTDVCEDDDAADPAALGAPCAVDGIGTWCAVANTIPFGVCEIDFDEDGTRLCRPRCASNEDCDGAATCQPVVYDADGGGRGYCAPSP